MVKLSEESLFWFIVAAIIFFILGNTIQHRNYKRHEKDNRNAILIKDPNICTKTEYHAVCRDDLAKKIEILQTHGASNKTMTEALLDELVTVWPKNSWSDKTWNVLCQPCKRGIHFDCEYPKYACVCEICRSTI